MPRLDDPRGQTAPQAAGVIHTDFERGFIKAEVQRWEDLVALGSEAAVKEKGLLRIEGKEYVVQDGDCMHFRFNVYPPAGSAALRNAGPRGKTFAAGRRRGTVRPGPPILGAPAEASLRAALPAG